MQVHRAAGRERVALDHEPAQAEVRTCAVRPERMAAGRRQHRTLAGVRLDRDRRGRSSGSVEHEVAVVGAGPDVRALAGRERVERLLNRQPRQGERSGVRVGAGRRDVEGRAGRGRKRRRQPAREARRRRRRRRQVQRLAVAARRTEVRGRSPDHRQEAPVVATLVQRQLHHAMSVVEAHGAVRLRCAEAVGHVAARADGDLRDPVGQVEAAERVLRQEALVDVLVAVEDEVGAVLVQRLPDEAHVGVVPVDVARAVEVVVEGRERADRGVVREVVPQPGVLRRAEAAVAGVVARGVEHDHVPAAHVVAVVALRRGRPRRRRSSCSRPAPRRSDPGSRDRRRPAWSGS